MMADNQKPALKGEIPQGRTYEGLLNHYRVEKAIADKLKASDREARRALYATMYDELFAAVPDHPRLTGAHDPGNVNSRNKGKFRLVKDYVTKSTVALEFAPGDCAFSHYLCGHVATMYSVDISDQDASPASRPGNYRSVIYDGYSLPWNEPKIDLAFSDQFIEHLHPEDVEHHFRLVRSLVKDGGWYVFRTPHAAHGPFDVSAFFSDTPQGFHLKEWTYSELGAVLSRSGFSRWVGKRRISGEYRTLPTGYWRSAEWIIRVSPRQMRKLTARLFVPRHLVIAARA